MRHFDHNATHPLCAAARTAWLDAVDRFPANPSSPHRWGQRAAHAVEEARDTAARWLGCRPEEILWTSGATESNNTLIRHLGRTTEGTVLVSAIEHPSMERAIQRWLGGRSEEIPVPRSGRVDPGWIQGRLRTGPVAAVVAMAANNETGVLQPWDQVRELCAAAGVPFACDAAQWVGKLPAAGLGACDFVTGCGHKFGAPQGVGFLKAPPDLQPLLVGGPQEDGRRAGTENVAGILSMMAAWSEREQRLQSPGDSSNSAIAQRLQWRDQWIATLHADLPDAVVVGADASRLWNTVSVLMPPAADCRRRWVVKLDRLGFAVSTGSACASGKEQPSRVLAAMGFLPDESDRMLRFSAGWETTPEDWDALGLALRRAAMELNASGNQGQRHQSPAVP